MAHPAPRTAAEFYAAHGLQLRKPRQRYHEVESLGVAAFIASGAAHAGFRPEVVAVMPYPMRGGYGQACPLAELLVVRALRKGRPVLVACYRLSPTHVTCQDRSYLTTPTA